MQNYNLISIIFVLIACVPFYLTYEKREGSIRRMVLIAVMTAIAVSGRCLFVALPGFKPVTAIVTLSGIFMGAQSGFLVGSLSAIISNIFFGQGPWTPYQMLAWGLIGMLAGLPGLKMLLRKKVPLAIFGVFSGIFYTVVLNIWSVISIDSTWNWSRYLTAFGTSAPITAVYMISNVVFLLLTIKPIGEKLNRMQIKHGIF